MALTEIQYGSIARSQVLNDNFNYLEERISEIATNLSQTYATLVALVNSQTSSVTNNLNNEVATLNGEIDTVDKNLKTTSDKLNASIVVTKSWRSGTSWYRVWSDGWIEQGGYANITKNGQVVDLHKDFTNTNYFVMGNGLQAARYASCHTRTVGTFAVYTGDDSSFNAGNICWYACGY